MPRNKYYSRKITIEGMTFDSKKEARRYRELRLLEKAGEVTDLKRQVEYELIPAQFEEIPTGETYKRGDRKGQPKTKRVCLELGVKYVADFTYTTKDGETVVEDVKGYKGGGAYSMFTIKRKLMLYVHGIRIREV
ncbi:MAG: DUF1064 domain-containing protein [Clostridia bacterium]|nr:DUF1064 domain-containing protein [Bacteroidales bacterium]MBO5789568.1 DUF1064 domain-containing protein [Clostridia bacterium]MBO7150977.1 DUF1064 domain-containing protein [Clostridia bacterium]